MKNNNELISSAHNLKIKELITLETKSKERNKRGLFVVEGKREIANCISAGYIPFSFFICPEIYFGSQDSMAMGSSIEDSNDDIDLSSAKTFEVSSAIYEKIAYRSSTEGIVAEFKSIKATLDDIVLKTDKPAFVIVLESVEKPGNLGAVLRTADASGADAVIICDPLTDLYNPNLIRSSLGGIFTTPTVACSSEEALSWLKKNNIQILTAQLQDSKPYYSTDMTISTAVVFGTESTGLTDFWREVSDAKIIIPMLGRLDSLNISVSVAILSYEAVRQRLSQK